MGQPYFFEFDGSRYIEQPKTPNTKKFKEEPPFLGNMLILPTGQIMLTDTTTDIQIYTPGDTSFNPAWRAKD